MTQERWQVIEELFHAALDLPESERQRYLDESCGRDAALRAEVDSLLSSDRQSTDPETPTGFSPIAERVRRAAVLVAYPPREGDRIGHYRVIQEIGHGGMGLVYRATRADQEFQMQVAIKVAKTGMDTATILERFRHERQILASLDHRYVAKLLDGGTTTDGLPYFVMEYVEGQPIHRYARAKNLSLRDRLVLFRGVLEAVAYAHQNLVVHLDLKPSNILIAADGTPKLLDFGIARLLEPAPNSSGEGKSSSDDAAAPTPTGTTAFGRLLTPDYASPEQIRGEPVSTATDVYSLGAVLYQVLTGELPHRLEGLTPRQVERVICALDVIRPSERVPAMRRELGGDLDNIVMKAMAKDSARRYRSAQELDDELRRYLEGLPVRAVTGSGVYRLQKFLWRNRWATAAGVAIFLSLLGGLVVARWQARLADAQRHVAETERNRAEVNAIAAQRSAAEAQANASRAEAEAARAERALQNAESSRHEAVAEKKLADQRSEDVRKLSTTYLFDFNDALENSPGTLPVRRHMVDMGIRFLDGLSKAAGNNTKLRTDLASAYMRLGDVLGNPETSNLGDTKAALESYRKALSMVENLPPGKMERGEYLLAQMDLRRRMGEILTVAGSNKDSLEEYAKGVQAAREALQEHEGVRRFDEKVANILTGYSHALVQSNQDQAGLAAVKENYAVLTRMIARYPDSTDFPSWLATDYSNEGRALAHLGDLQGSVDAYRKEIAFLEEVDRKAPPDPPRTRVLMFAYSHLGDMLGNPQMANLGDFNGAIAAYEKMSHIASTVAAADRENAAAQLDAAMSVGRLGGLHLGRHDAAAAVPPLQESVAGLQRLVTRDPSNRSNILYLSNNLELLGDAQLALGQLADAKASYSKEIATIAPILSADGANPGASATSVEGHLKLGLALSQEGDATALDQINQAVAEVTRFRGLQPAEPRLTLRLARSLGVRAMAGYRLAMRPGVAADARVEGLRQARADVLHAEELAASVPPERRATIPASTMAVIADAHRLLTETP
jgi:serine/threonine protein kinase